MRIAVYVAAGLLEAVCISLWLIALAEFRHDALVFFEIVICGGLIVGLIAWKAKHYAEKPKEYGRLASRIEDWERLQAIMREEERQRRRHGA